MKSIRLLIADDHALVRSGIRLLAEELDDVSVVGEAENGVDAIEIAQREKPDILLLDGSMPELNGLEVTAWMKENQPQTRVILLTMHAEDEYVLEALRAGAAGYLLKRSATVELGIAVYAVAAGKTYVSPAVSRTLVAGYLGTDPGMEPRAQLTPRQREVLKLVAQGKSSREIGELLQLSPRTVETHRAEIMRRLDVKDVAALVRHALKMGLVDTDSEA